MILFPTGITLTRQEYLSLVHITSAPEDWVSAQITEKARLRREALISEWRPRLFADADVTELPATDDGLVAVIMARPGYKTKAESHTDRGESIPTHNKDRYDSVTRVGDTETLFPSGITVSDTDIDCILAYIHDASEWVLGCLLGQINRGKKKMIRKYEPIIRADPSVTTMPATEDGLITMIVARSDYRAA